MLGSVEWWEFSVFTSIADENQYDSQILFMDGINTVSCTYKSTNKVQSHRSLFQANKKRHKITNNLNDLIIILIIELLYNWLLIHWSLLPNW